MPIYHFEISDNGRISRDMEGYELLGPQQARDEAVGVLPDLARDELPDGDEHVFEATVRDATGRAIFRARLSLHCVWLDQDQP